MGVATTAVLALGKEFTSRNQVERFLREHGHLADVSGDDVDADGLEEHTPDGVMFQSLDLYSDDYFYLGINLRGGTAERFREELDEAIASWKRLFPNVEPDVIYTVRYH